MKKLALLAVFLALPIFGQTAKVIALSPADATEAKTLYAQREALDKKIEALREKITRSYLVEDKVRDDSKVLFQYLILKHGWRHDFLYSEDFRFIVPNVATTYVRGDGSWATPNPCSSLSAILCGIVNTPYWIGPANTLTPATGTFLAN